MDYTVEKLLPFGAIIRNEGRMDSVEEFSPELLQTWVSEYKLLVFRGFKSMPKQDLALFGQQLGKPLQWSFGAINDLKVKPDTENYIFTDHAVPMHWDGAFVGTIPYIILFQCLVAPKKEDMGGTTFANTANMVQQASPETLAQWEQVRITYRTKKIVHYGGEITQEFLARHEVEHTPVIRYAEPVEDLNPVSLDIHGLQGKSPAEFVEELKALLYHPDNLYTHRWEAGDIVLADNHRLLHGREAFKNSNERYIQRVNILHRPKGFSLKRFISNNLTIRRKEFFVAELPIFLIPLLLNIQALTDFLQPMLYLGLLAIILLFNIGDIINCYADYKLDAIYKSHLSNAVYELGKVNVKMQIVLTGVLALVCTTIVAVYTGQLYLIPLTLVGTFIGLQYSVRPLKFKSRGIWQLFCLWGIIFLGPMLYTAIITSGFPGLLQLVLFSLYGFHQMGIIMLNTAEDFTEDKASGLVTIVVKLGFHRAMNFSYWLIIVTGFLLQVTFAYFLFRQGAPWYLFLGIGIFTFGWGRIIAEYRLIIARLNRQEEEAAIQEVKKNGMKVPRWLNIGAYTSLAMVAFYFIWNMYH